ncbi:MAG TPA: hypothetical protein VMT83_04335 [Burkholderiaceae bacterium]|jgi:hypothetical protein|nr:hypothetical protein [Burkholderiaceae bacterium]
MSTSTVTVRRIGKVDGPRRPDLTARLAAALKGLLSRKPRESSAGEATAKEAAMVRAMAHRHMSTDPGFAADLMAAADRHEAAANAR